MAARNHMDHGSTESIAEHLQIYEGGEIYSRMQERTGGEKERRTFPCKTGSGEDHLAPKCLAPCPPPAAPPARTNSEGSRRSGESSATEEKRKRAIAERGKRRIAASALSS
jgi:hypothetical protein